MSTYCSCSHIGQHICLQHIAWLNRRAGLWVATRLLVSPHIQDSPHSCLPKHTMIQASQLVIVSKTNSTWTDKALDYCRAVGYRNSIQAEISFQSYKVSYPMSVGGHIDIRPTGNWISLSFSLLCSILTATFWIIKPSNLDIIRVGSYLWVPRKIYLDKKTPNYKRII